MNKTEPVSATPRIGVQAFVSQTACRLNPKKLLLSKWTAVTPHDQQKHFIVTRVIQPEPSATPIERIELEAVYSRRVVFSRPWRDLSDRKQWRQGWQ